MSTEVTINIIVSLVGVIIGIFGVYTYFKDRKKSEKKNTLDAYEILQKETLDKINLLSPSEIKSMCEDNKSSEFKILSGYLANIERFCVGINEGIYDFNVFYIIAHGYFDEGGMLMNRLLPIIDAKRVSPKEDYYKNIHDVWEKMHKKNVKMK